MLQMVVVALAPQQDSRPLGLQLERIHAVLDGSLEDVVRQQHHGAAAAGETLRQPKRFGDAARLLLVRVEEPVDAERLPVAEESKELAGVGAAGEEHHLGYAGLLQGLDSVADYLAVIDR